MGQDPGADVPVISEGPVTYGRCQHVTGPFFHGTKAALEDGWEEHAPEVVAGMLDGLARLREQGLDVIED